MAEPRGYEIVRVRPLSEGAIEGTESQERNINAGRHPDDDGTRTPLSEEVREAREAAVEAMDELREKLGPPVHFRLTTRGRLLLYVKMARWKIENGTRSARYALGCSLYRLACLVADEPLDGADIPGAHHG